MAGNRRPKRQFDIEDYHPTLLLIAVTAGLLSLFAPVVIIPITQEMLHFDGVVLEILTPTMSYRMMMAALLWIPFVAGLYFFTRKLSERRRVPYRSGPLMVILVLLALPVMAFSIQHVVVLEEEGFHYNRWYEWSGTWYDWGDVDAVQPVRESMGGVLHMTYRFQMNDGEEVVFESDDDFRRVRGYIFETVEARGGEMLPTVDEDEYEPAKE